MTSSASPVIVLGVTDLVSLRLLRGHPAHLAGEGWDVHVVAAGSGDVAGATSHRIAMRRQPAPLSDLGALIAWIRLLRKLTPSVVMVGTPKAGLLGIIAAWFCRVPRRVYLLRGLRLEGVTGVLAGALWFSEFVACRLATDVLAVSPSLAAESVAKRFVARGRIHVLGPGSSNGVDVAEFRPPTATERAQARKTIGVAGDRLVVGYVGRVHEDKGVDTLLSAASTGGVRDLVTLVIVGRIESESLRRSIATHSTGIQTSMVIMDHTDDVRAALWAMDILALPSRREGFPNVVLEAGACGVPAVVSNATGCRDAVIDGQTGWVIDVGDSDALASTLAAIDGHRSQLVERGASARQWVSESFARDTVWARLDEYLASPPRSEDDKTSIQATRQEE